MCYGSQRLPLKDELSPQARAVERLRRRLIETEARLERARAREAELSRRLDEMKRFVSVMEIVENYLKQRLTEQQQVLADLLSSRPNPKPGEKE